MYLLNILLKRPFLTALLFSQALFWGCSSQQKTNTAEKKAIQAIEKVEIEKDIISPAVDESDELYFVMEEDGVEIDMTSADLAREMNEENDAKLDEPPVELNRRAEDMAKMYEDAAEAKIKEAESTMRAIESNDEMAETKARQKVLDKKRELTNRGPASVVPTPKSKTSPIKKPKKAYKAASKSKKTRTRRRPASVGRFYRLKRDCNMRAGASGRTQKLGIVRKGKKLWADPHSDNWVKIYRKSGPAYMSASCL